MLHGPHMVTPCAGVKRGRSAISVSTRFEAPSCGIGTTLARARSGVEKFRAMARRTRKGVYLGLGVCLRTCNASFSHEGSSGRSASEGDPSGHPERPGLRGLPENRRFLGASAPVPDMRPRWLLRLLAEPAREKTLPCKRPPDRPVLRAGRGLALVLCGPSRGVSRKEPIRAQRPGSRLRACRSSDSYLYLGGSESFFARGRAIMPRASRRDDWRAAPSHPPSLAPKDRAMPQDALGEAIAPHPVKGCRKAARMRELQ